MNVILEKIQDLKIFIMFLSSIFLSGILVGYLLSPKPKPKEIMCAKEIKQVVLLGSQIKTLREKHLNKIKTFQHECIIEQNQICSQKIIRYRAACLELKCEICKASK
jgi:hypothetical protein